MKHNVLNLMISALFFTAPIITITAPTSGSDLKQIFVKPGQLYSLPPLTAATGSDTQVTSYMIFPGDPLRPLVSIQEDRSSAPIVTNYMLVPSKDMQPGQFFYVVAITKQKPYGDRAQSMRATVVIE